MPKLCEFYGVVIRMYHTDHGPPHFHAEYAGREAAISLDGRILHGRLHPRAMRLVREWARLRRRDLDMNWSRASKGGRLVRIEPLE